MTARPDIAADRSGRLSGRLRAETAAEHQSLDDLIRAKDAFASVERYGKFLEVQHRFHERIAPLYREPRWQALIPDLSDRSRADDVETDLADLGLQPFRHHAPIELGTAGLGWLYVAEGSTLGAAFLIREAGLLGFDESHGARHLAGSPEGRARHWRQFTDAVDAITLTEDDSDAVVEGARAAFRSVRVDVEEIFAR